MIAAALRAIVSDFMAARISPTRILLMVAVGALCAWLWGLLDWPGTYGTLLPFPGYLAGIALSAAVIYTYIWWRERP